MKKAERLFQMMTYLRSRRTAVTAAVLADRMNVSERTVYRDIQSLILSGVPVEGEAGVGYILNINSTIAPLMFNESEVEALMLGARLVKSLADDGMAEAADSALTKIRSVIPEPLMLQLNNRITPFLVPDVSRQEKTKFSQVIRSAIQNNVTLVVEYTDVKNKKSEREVEPLGLIFWGANWTLVAWCKLRNGYRTFRLDRLTKLVESGLLFEPQVHSLSEYIQQFDQGIKTDYWGF